jgi:hypothetical protein
MHRTPAGTKSARQLAAKNSAKGFVSPYTETDCEIAAHNAKVDAKKQAKMQRRIDKMQWVKS